MYPSVTTDIIRTVRVADCLLLISLELIFCYYTAKYTSKTAAKDFDVSEVYCYWAAATHLLRHHSQRRCEASA
jgi:hypothetical protein